MLPVVYYKFIVFKTRTDVLSYISLIPVFGYLWPGTSTMPFMLEVGNRDRSLKLRHVSLVLGVFGD